MFAWKFIFRIVALATSGQGRTLARSGIPAEGVPQRDVVQAASLTSAIESASLCFVIGGPDGVSAACRERADFVWSLSALTLPHGLARVLFAEQLYRAWTLLSGHPYHRD